MIAKGKNGDQRRKQKQRRKALSWLMVLCMLMTMFSTQFAAAEAGDVPAHEKSLSDNHDGTYKLELSVTGDADTETQTAANVNVLVVLDTSNSMTMYNAGSGNRPPRRADAAEKVVYDFTQDLFAYQDTQHPTNIQMALVTFNTNAYTTQNWTSTQSDITGKLSATGTRDSRKLTYNSGTNWERGLMRALDVLEDADGDPTFVIFVTDGAPTQTNTNTNINTQYATNYRAALNEARELEVYKTGDSEEDNTTFYGIYAYGDEADYLDDLVYYSQNGAERTAGAGTVATPHYYNASDTSALEAAIEEIFQEIVNTLGVNAVSIADGTTNGVETSTGPIDMLEVDDSSFEYWLSIPVVNNQFTRINPTTGEETTYTVTVNGNTCTVTGGASPITVTGSVQGNNFKFKWEGATELSDGKTPPAATFVDNEVKWDLKSVGTLLDGVTYSVSFDVWPSQYTYDTLAKIQNGDQDYDALPENVKKYLTEDGALTTNTYAKLTYSDNRTDPAITDNTVDYNELKPVPLVTEHMSVTKKWENTLDARKVGSIKMTVLMDGDEFHEVTLSDPEWKQEDIKISTGIMRTKNGEMQILDEGHDFTFAELGPEQFNWELVAPVMHPMIIDGTLTMLIMVDDAHPAQGAQTYVLKNKKYYVAGTGEANLDAFNYRRSNLNLLKVVDGEDADPDQTFPFTLVVNNGKATPAGQTPSDDTNSDDFVWFSIDSDPDPEIFTPVTNAEVTGATQSGNYYYTRSGSTITVQMKAGWNLRFTNLPTETTYTFTEGTMPTNYAFDSATLTNGEGAFSGGQTSTGSIDNTNTSYEVTYTNKYGLEDIEITKEWDDSNNQDGVRPTATEFVSWLTLKADGTDVTAANASKLVVTDNGNGTYTAKWTGLDRYKDNKEIKYTVTETPSSDYTPTSTTAEDHGTITNPHTPEVIDIPVEKIWDDADNQDGIRPASVTVKLLADGVDTGKTLTLNAGNNWEGTFEDVEKFKEGETGTPIVYTIEEVKTSVITGTDADGTYGITYGGDMTEGLTVTNIHTPIDTEYSVVKVWNDDENKDGHRPDDLTVYLMANGNAAVDKDGNPITATLNDANSWAHTWKDIPKYANGSAITYTASEDTSGSWASFYETTTVHGTGLTTITNSRESDKTTYKVVKIWDDVDNQDGIRPTSIKAQLYRDGEAYLDAVTLNEGNSWTYTWEGLEKNKPVEAVTESTDENAEPTEPGRSVNAAPAEESVTEESTPDETVAAPTEEAAKEEATTEEEPVEEETGDTEEAVEAGSETEEGLGDINKREAPTRAVAVKAYIYTADEVNVPEGYTRTTKDITDTEGNITGIEITNKHVPETTTVTVEKLWADANDQDGIRKDVGATVQLFKTVNGTTTAVADPVDVAITDGWTYSWGDLPVNEDGKQITYTVVETLPNGSKYTKSGDDVAMPAEEGDSGTTTITNSYEPEETKVTVTKTWADQNNQDGKRADVNATVQLYKTVDGARAAVGEPVAVGTADDWSKTWEELPVNENGKQITYSVVETIGNANSGYTKSGDDKTLPAVKDDSGTIAITNTYEPSTTDVEITKIWDDADDQDGYRPDADGFKAKLHLWMSYVTTAEDGTTTEHKDDVTADYPLTVTDNDDGTYTVSVDGLPMFKPGSIGSQITWTISEDEIAEYEAAGAVTEVGNGGEITNKHVPETMTMTVNKLWADANDQDGKRDDVNATVQLYKKVGEAAPVPVNPNEVINVGTADDWSKTWDNLPVKENGTTLVYSVVETLPDGSEYTKSGDDVTVTASKDGKGEITITNSYEPKTIDIDVAKIWDDENDQDGKRADVGATIQLYANGEPVGEAVEVGAEDDWSNEWTGLPVYEDGEAISYQVVETLPDGSVYTTTPVPAQTAQEDKDISFEVTNSYEPEKINISVTKEWDDADDQDGKRADVGATVQLYANDVAVGDPVDVGEADDWSNTWTGLPVYEDGEEISYKVVETLPDGSEYSTQPVAAQTAAEDTNLTFDITNSYEPKTINIDVTKIWDDADDQDGKRADVGATIQLYANDVAVGDPVEVGAEDDWTNAWTDLPVYEDGEQISYKVVETLPDGTEYTTEPVEAQTAEEDEDISFEVTNSYEPKTIDIDVSKIWDDADDVDGKRADVGATIQLYANDVAVGDPVEVGAEDDWTNQWTDLPVYDEGVEITYKVVETLPDGSEYTVTQAAAQTASEEEEALSFEVKNSYEPETVYVEGAKVWDLDGYEDDAEELMPESITVKLIADGAETPVATKVLTAEDADEDGNWTYKFEDLPKYEFDENGKGGKLIEYTVDEMLVPGFIKEIDDEVVSITDEDQKVIGYTTGITNKIDVQQSANEVELNIEKVDEYGTPLKDVEFTLDNGAEGDAAKTITEKTNDDGVATITIPVAEGWLGTDEREQDAYTFNLTEAVPTGYIFEAEGESGGTNSWTVTVKWDGEAAVYTIKAVEEESDVQVSYFDRLINWVLDNVAGEHGEFANDKVVITNIREKIDLPVEKLWEEDPRYDIRPESITVKLLADGEDTGKTLVLKGSDDPEKDWKGTFKDLDKYSFDENGKAIDVIDYTVEEVEVNGYETEITGSVEDGYTITNTMKFGDVRITKDLLTYEDSSQATFVYSVKATMEVAGKKDPVVVYDGVVTLDFTSATTASAVIEHLPAGAVVEVEETYSGAVYDQKSGPDWDVDDQTIIADEEIGVEFSNAYNGELTQGYGILNEYEAEGGSWVHLDEVINSNDEGKVQ